MAAAHGAFVAAAELGDSGGLAGAGGAGDDEAPAGGDLVAVQQHQAPPGGGDLADGRGGHGGQPGVVVQASFVVVGPGLLVERKPLLSAELGPGASGRRPRSGPIPPWW